MPHLQRRHAGSSIRFGSADGSRYTIANPVFAFVSLNGNGYAFLNQDFNILSVGGEDGNACGYWGCGGVTKVVTDIGGGNFMYALNSSNVGGSEPHGVIQFTGAFDTLTWESASNEYWNGFTVGVQGTAQEVFQPVPEPGTLTLVALGILLTLAVHGRRSETARLVGRPISSRPVSH